MEAQVSRLGVLPDKAPVSRSVPHATLVRKVMVPHVITAQGRNPCRPGIRDGRKGSACEGGVCLSGFVQALALTALLVVHAIGQAHAGPGTPLNNLAGANPFGDDNPFNRPLPIGQPAGTDQTWTAIPPADLPETREHRPSACPETLADLVATWPRYRDPMLSQLQDTMKGESVAQAIAQAKAQGKTARRAISDLQRQADAYDDSAAQAARCASQLNATMRSPEAFLHDGRQGVFISLSCRAGARAACVCQMIQTQLGAQYNRALAEAFACHAGERPW